MALQKVADLLVYLVVRVFICVIQSLSLETCTYLAGALATLLTDVLRVRKSVLDDNLAHAYPNMRPDERRDLTWRMWRHLFLLLSEIAHAPRKIHTTNWRDYIELQNSPLIVRTMFDERPAVFVSAHYGNFELAGYVLGIFGFPTYTVARPLDNPYIDRFINRFRSAKGQHILPKNGSAPAIDHLLASGGALSLLADQYAGAKGCWVSFFGRPASTHKAVAVFSLSNDAPLLVSYARRKDRALHYQMGTEATADPRDSESNLGGVRELTEWYTLQLERIIRRAPDQYWWIHRRWKDDRGDRRRRSAA